MEDYTIRAVETNEDLRLANDLMAKSHGDYYGSLHWLETSGAGYPGYRREHTRIAVCGGEVAGALRVNTDVIRLGEARLKMGGFGWVSTAAPHRQKGVCRALMLDALDYMGRNNYHAAMLFGIPNFYHRYGFVSALPDYSIAIEPVEAVPVSMGATRIRGAKPGDIPMLQKIHAANDALVACSLLRSGAHLTNKWERCKNLKVIVTQQGKIVAYVSTRRDGDALAVDEVGVTTSVSCDHALAACARAAADEFVGQMRFHVPPSHPFAHYLLLYNSAHQMRVARDRGGMMAFVNTPEALENLIPEWESLLVRSALRDRRIEVTLFLRGIDQAGGNGNGRGEEVFRIRANRGAIDVAPLAGGNRVTVSDADLLHMVVGYRHVDDILAVPRRLIVPDARAFLNVIFPKRSPYVWLFDRF